MKGCKTGSYIFAENSSKAGNPHDTRTSDFVNEEPLAGEHSFAESLVLHFLSDALSGCHKSILAHVPGLVPCETDTSDVPKERRGEEKLARTGIGGGSHFTASYQFLHRELDVAFKSNGGGHGDHDT